MEIYALKFEEKIEKGLFEDLLQFVNKEKRKKISILPNMILIESTKWQCAPKIINFQKK